MTAIKPKAHTVASLWNDVTPPSKNFPTLQGENQSDVVIIGGGFTGLSCALHLAKAGHAVTLLEGRTIGFGGSGRNSGQVIPVLSGPEPEQIEKRYGQTGERLVSLIAESAEFLFALARQENIDCEAEQTGWFQPAHTSGHMKTSAARVKAWSKRGAPAQLLDKDECEKLLGSKQWFGGMLNPTGGHINPMAFARGLATACSRAGVKIFENSIAEQVRKSGSGWQVLTPTGSVKTNAVLMATNAYSNELSTTLETKTARSLIPVTSWQMATPPLSQELREEIMPNRQAVSDTRGDLQFFRYDARNRLVTGAALMVPFNAEQRLKTMVGARLAKAFPQLGAPEFTHVWSGFVGMTMDRYPHFHQLGDNYWSAIGFNGRGVALAVAIGAEMAKAIAGENIKTLALPLSKPAAIAFQPIARRVARLALPYYRWLDTRPPKP